jgi:hypothetical protein
MFGLTQNPVEECQALNSWELVTNRIHAFLKKMSFESAKGRRRKQTILIIAFAEYTCGSCISRDGQPKYPKKALKGRA